MCMMADLFNAFEARHTYPLYPRARRHCRHYATSMTNEEDMR